MKLFGDILLEQGNNIDFPSLIRLLKRPIVKPRYRVSVLNPDETVNYIIPSEDIPEDGISYTEEYQNGQRRNFTLKLLNGDKKYTPSINKIWLSTKFRLDIGLVIKDEPIWFPRGIYVMGDVNLTNSDTEKSISIQLKDKFSVYEGKMGTLENAYEIEIDSDISDVLNGIRSFSMGNGYILDYKEIILDPSFVGFKTKSTIRIEEGGNLGQVIAELATQMSAEYYYNNVGNLCFYPINETIDDSSKPVIWTFSKLSRNIWDLQLDYRNEEVVNVVKVVGDNIENGIFSAIVTNDNPASPICVQQIGRRAAPKYTEPNVWNNENAYDLACYYLRQSSFVAVDFSCMVGFNPILTVNNICEMENDFIGATREKLLITSISFNSSNNTMSLKLCNTKDLPFA